MKNQTPVEWLESYIESYLREEMGPTFKEMFAHAKKIEMARLIQAFIDGSGELKWDQPQETRKKAEEYFDIVYGPNSTSI